MIEFVKHNGISIGAIRRGAEQFAGKTRTFWVFTPTRESGLPRIEQPTKRALLAAVAARAGSPG